MLRILAVLAALALAPSAQAQSMKLASATINDVQHEWQKVFAAELEKRAPGKVKPLVVWFVSPRRGACIPDEDCLPEGEGHSVDPPGLQRQDDVLRRYR